MELRTCPGCKRVFLGDLDRQFCPLCAVIQKSLTESQRLPADPPEQKAARETLKVA